MAGVGGSSLILATTEQVRGWTGLEDIRLWANMTSGSFTSVMDVLGDPQHPRIMACLPIDALRNAVQIARVPLPTPEGGWPAEATAEERSRNLTATEVTQVGLVYRGARQKVGLHDLDPFDLSGMGAPSPVTPTAATAGPGGSTAPVVMITPDKTRKVKMCTVLDQADEAELQPLPMEEREKCYRRLRDRKEGSVRPETEFTEDQLTALYTRVVTIKDTPYADFALFTPFNLRFNKAL